MRASCPRTSQPFDQPCTVSSFQMVDKALTLSHNATGLRPYTNYDFMVMAYNDEGLTQSPVTLQATLGAGMLDAENPRGHCSFLSLNSPCSQLCKLFIYKPVA